MDPRALVRRRPVTVFVVLVLALAWPMHVLGEQLPVLAGPPLALLGPGACAVWVTWVAEGRHGTRRLLGRLTRWQVPVRWYLFALLALAAAYWTTAYAIALVLAPDGPAPPPTAQLLVVPLNLLVLVLVLGLVEELGWRGFLLPRLSARLSPLVAALAVGLVWWAWHLPIRVRLDQPDGAALAALFAVGILGDSVVLAWLFHRTGGSVLLPTLMHAASNTWGGALYQQTFSADPPGYLPFEVVRMGTFALAAVLVVALTRGRLGADGRCRPAVVG